MDFASVGTVPRESLSVGLLPKTWEDLKGFVGLGTQTRAKTDDTAAQLNQVFGEVTRLADELFVTILEQRSAESFRQTVERSFNDYVHLMRAKGDLIRFALRNDTASAERLVDQSLSSLEADFRHEGAVRFGQTVNEQAVFTIWTLRRTVNQIWRVHAAEVALTQEQLEAREALTADFGLYSAWAQLHLATLSASLRLNRPIHPDVAPAVLDGLRAMVNAGGFARQLIDMALPSAGDDELEPYEWDDEDDELVRSSMADLDGEAR